MPWGDGVIAEHEKNLGNCIAVIRGDPREYKVTQYNLKADSNDPLNRITVAYQFVQTRPANRNGGIEVTIKISSRLSHSYLKSVRYEDLVTVIRFAFDAIRGKPGQHEFLFSSDDYETITKQPKLTGRKLRRSILEFISRVNDVWPAENIGIFDLLENLNASREEGVEWLNNLMEAGYLIRDEYKTYKRAGESVETYRINAAKLKEIQEELKTAASENGKLKIFLSYSHKDKQIAGDVKKEFEEYGFEAFVAHDDIELSREWEDKILEELRACHVFIPILTENFKNSPWTDQEAGHALAGSKVIIPLRVSIDPYGFIGRFQGEKLHKEQVTDSCRKIVEVLSTRSELTGFFTEGSKAVRKLKGSPQEA